MPEFSLVTLDPGHFHAALVQKEMYPGVARQVHVYAPLGPDLLAHLQRIAGFNQRLENPTAWELEVHAGSEYLAHFLRDRPGNIVVLAGRNRTKIDYILAALEQGLHVLADKPWIIASKDFPKLEAALNLAESRGLVAYDIMTERYEISSILQKALLNDAEVFGQPIAGSPEAPGVFMESKHYLMKTVAGAPLRRPAWFFDVHQQGEGLTDVGTHLVDLAPWMLFPQQSIDWQKDVAVTAARRWPTTLTRQDFQRVTGEADFPAYLADSVQDERLDYCCNTLVSYTLRGIHVTLNILWDYEAAAGAGDTHLAIFRGTRSRLEVRQGADEHYRPELFVIPAERGPVFSAVQRRVSLLQASYPGVGVVDQGERFWITIPERYRVGHEAHFAEVTRQFLAYLAEPASLPAWEKPNMLAKYAITTQGIDLARSHQGTPA